VRGLIFGSVLITTDQKGNLITMMHDKKYRDAFANILYEVGSQPRLIKNS